MKIKLKNIFKLKNILIVALFLISLIIIGVTYKLSYSMKTVASSAGNYTREEVENMVVATALSYYRNKKYSEFDQNSMDNKDTIRWRNFNISPELMNRTNYYQGDYSSFVASVYMHSLGYDFSDYFELTGSTYYNFDTSTNTFISKLAKTSKDNFKEAYSLYGKGIDTNFFTKIGKKIADNNDYTAGTEYENDNNDNVVVYFYEVTGEETSEEQKQIKENLISNLKPGDIVVYRAEVNGSPAGNAVLYIGDAIDNEEGYKGGFIRSYGSDYSVKDDGVTIGDDRHSIRYEGMYQLWDNLFPDSTTKTSTSFTVLRPINSYCKDDNCTLDEKSSPNLAARVDLSGLTIEQYASKSNIEANVVIDGDLNVVDKEKLTSLYEFGISEHNSVNVGDTLNYNLFLHNNSKRSYCYGSGYYISKESCEQYGHEWRLSTADEVVYKNLIIEAEVPENTEFISCNYSCKYDSNSRKVTWENTSDLKNTYYRAYTYKVKVMSGDKVINEGMKITTQNSNVLQMGKIETNVNPTLSKLNVIDLAENIKKFKKLLDDDIIEHSNSSTKSDYNLDDLNEKVGISAFGFVENIYYNTLNIDLGYLSTSNIKNAIFNVDSKSNYAKKTEEEIEALADENYKNINKMLVKGFYGGRYLRGNDNKDRKGRLRISDLEIGDIIVPYNTTTSSGIASNAAAIMYLGTFNDSSLNSKNSTIKQEYNSYFIKFNSNGITLYTQNSELSSYTLFNELYSKDLFVVLRPTQLYGTTVNYENVENVSETVSVENGTYQHLKQNSSFKLTLDSGENDIEEINAPYTLSWYKDKDYKYRLNSGDSLINENSHSVYAKVKYTTHTLPSPKKVGYTFKGWYDKDDDKKVANSGDNYEIKKITTLYADWELIIPNIEQTSNNKYIINDSYIEKIQVKTDLKGLELGLEDYYTYKVYNRNYQEKSNGNIATGDKINIYLNDDTLVNSYTAVIKGDITGTGEVTIADVAKLFQYYRGKITMEEMFQKAGNMVTADNEIKINDVAKLYQYIRGKINSLEG